MATSFFLIIAAALAVFFVSTTKRLAFLAVIAMFVTRPALDVGGLSVRLELLVGILAFLRIVHQVLSRRSTRVSPTLAWSVSFVVAWLAFAAATSLHVPPIPSRSMSVLVWCLLNVITAVWIARTPETWHFILRWGSTVAMIGCFAAIIFWAAASTGVFVYGVQVDPAYGGYAAYVFSIEANILAGLLCLWGLVGVANPMKSVPRWVRIGLAFAAPVAILTTHTRAALVAYVVGLLACLLFRPAARRVAVASLTCGGFGASVLFLLGDDAGFSKFAEVFDVDGGTGGLRYRVNSVAFTEWWTSPERWIGLGWNSFGQRHIDETQPGLMLPGYIGNLPLQIAYDAGIIGAAWVSLAAGLILVAVIRLRRFDMILIFLVPYILFSIATSSLWLLETWIFVGLAWGLCSGRAVERDSRPRKECVGRSEFGRKPVASGSF